MKDVYEIKGDNSAAQFKDADMKKGIVTGYFSHFNSLDSDGDIIRPGAYLKTIRENGPNSSRPRIKHLLNHDSHKPLGKLIDLKEDATGLYYESQVGTHDLGIDFIKMVESGLISEHSVGFQTIKRSALKEGDAKFELTELKLYEGSSLTAWGANMNTPITGMKSEQKAAFASKRIELLSKAIKDGSFTDETFELLDIELKQLQQLFIDLTKQATEPEATTQPEENKDVLAIETIKQFTQTLKK